MILSRADLKKALEAGDIEFTPALEDNQWGEVSIDLRLGFSFTRIRDAKDTILSVADGLGTIGGAKLWETLELAERDASGRRERFILEPGQFVLALTYESIKVPRHLIAHVEGRSTYARMGVSMHQTAPWIQPGASGPIVLEIMNNGPLHIALTPLEDRPCQITFFELKTEVPAGAQYGTRPTDKYQGQSHPLDHGAKTSR